MQKLNKKLRIALFYSQIVNPGGAERLLVEEAKYFNKKGMNTTILTFDYDRKSIYGYDESKIYKMKSKGNIISQTFNLIKTLRKIKPDIIVVHANAIHVFLATRIIKIPYLLHIHGTSFWFPQDIEKYSILHKKKFNEIRDSLYGHKEFNLKKVNLSIKGRIKCEIISLLNYFVIKNSKKIFTLTNQVKREIKLLYNKDAKVVRGGVDPALTTRKNKINIKEKYQIKDKRLILSVTRLDQRKRLDTLINAFNILQKNNDIILMIVGMGEDELRLKNKVRNLGIENKVIFVGYVSDNELPSYYASCDVFAFPGWCAYGLTVLEALLFDKPTVIATDAMVREVVENDDRIFVTAPDPTSFAKNIDNILSSKNILKYKNKIKIPMWDDYFEKIYQTILEIVQT